MLLLKNLKYKCILKNLFRLWNDIILIQLISFFTFGKLEMQQKFKKKWINVDIYSYWINFVTVYRKIRIPKYWIRRTVRGISQSWRSYYLPCPGNYSWLRKSRKDNAFTTITGRVAWTTETNGGNGNRCPCEQFWRVTWHNWR